MRTDIPETWSQSDIAFFAGRISVMAGKDATVAAWEEVNAGLTVSQQTWLQMEQPSMVRQYYVSFLRQLASRVSIAQWNQEVEQCKRRWGRWGPQ